MTADEKKKVKKKDEETVVKEMDLQTDDYLTFREGMEEGEEIEEEEPVFIDEEGNVHRIYTEY